MQSRMTMEIDECEKNAYHDTQIALDALITIIIEMATTGNENPFLGEKSDYNWLKLSVKLCKRAWQQHTAIIYGKIMDKREKLLKEMMIKLFYVPSHTQPYLFYT